MSKLTREHLSRKFGNYDKEQWINKDNWDHFLPLEISKKKGRGLVSKREFKKGDFLLFYRGKSLTEKEYQSQMVTSDN